MLGLPDTIRACLFDLDGVLTDTAALHRKAWAATFDPVLAEHGQSPFTDRDYEDHVDGKPRMDGVRDLLAARGIEATEQLVNELAERKNADVLRRIKQDGVEVFEGSRRYLEAARDAGLARVVVSSSANTADVLEVTGLAPLVEGRVDGVTLKERDIPGKPAPDSFLAGAQCAGVPPEAAAVFEDATAGVEAGRRGEFGFVVGVNRHDAEHADALRSHGASIVVGDLAELL